MDHETLLVLKHRDEAEAKRQQNEAIPEYGEQAAQIVLKMAEERALFIQKFHEDQLARAKEAMKVGFDFAAKIRENAQQDAERIRHSTSVTHHAGLRMKAAYEEFVKSCESHNTERDFDEL